MYNLFVSGNRDAWKSDTWELERSRCLREYTDEQIIKQFGDLDAAAITKLKRMPCIFAYESGHGLDPLYGVLRDIKKRQGLVRFKYEILRAAPFLSAQDLEQLSLKLDISKWELNRTHWAVKDVNLVRELRETRSIILPKRSHSRDDSRSAQDLTKSNKVIRTTVAKAVSANAEAVVLEVSALSVLIDEKLEALRSQRPNSKEAVERHKESIADYERLKVRVDALERAVSAFRANANETQTLASTAISFKDGMQAWWRDKHQQILDTSFNMGIFLSALGICSLLGVSADVGATITGVIAGGMPVVQGLRSLSPENNKKVRRRRVAPRRK